MHAKLAIMLLLVHLTVWYVCPELIRLVKHLVVLSVRRDRRPILARLLVEVRVKFAHLARIRLQDQCFVLCALQELIQTHQQLLVQILVSHVRLEVILLKEQAYASNARLVNIQELDNQVVPSVLQDTMLISSARPSVVRLNQATMLLMKPSNFLVPLDIILLYLHQLLAQCAVQDIIQAVLVQQNVSRHSQDITLMLTEQEF